MLKKIDRCGPALLAVFFIWYCWSGLDGGSRKKMDQTRPEPIPDAVLDCRKPGTMLALSRDPFFIDWSPYGPEFTPEAIAERKRREQAEREAKAAAKKREMEKKRMAAHSGLRPVPPEEMFEPFTLYLESVLVLPGRGCVARISGRSARVGEAIPGLDPKNPPVFDSVKEASTVVVRHRGTLYSLDLSKKRKVTIGPRGVQ